MQRFRSREVLLPEVITVKCNLVYVQGGQARVELGREALCFECRDPSGQGADGCAQYGVL